MSVDEVTVVTLFKEVSGKLSSALVFHVASVEQMRRKRNGFFKYVRDGKINRVDVGVLWCVFRVKVKCIVTTQIELPNELFSYVMIVSRLLPLTCCLTMESFRGVITFQPVLTRVNLRMG